ncbi:MAG: 3-oxoacyl-ACP synthase III [Pirellulaceae bacterium]
MRFRRARLAGVGFCIPPEVLSSGEIEQKLGEVYSRLRLPEGRLEGMSGVRERRLWPRGTRISDPSIVSGRRAIEGAGLLPNQIDCLFHASVCREFLEPATACRVHHELALPARSIACDLSNACLGLLNGALQIAMGIECGWWKSGLVVGTEDARGLIETTLQHLSTDPSLTRQSIKPAFASLTIGSGSCAWLIADESLAPEGRPIEHLAARAHTQYNALCLSDQDRAGSAMQPLMETDSEQLLAAGIETGKAAFEDLIANSGIARDQIDRTVCHQVGSTHRRLILEALQLPLDRDFATFPWLGNTGSVALPTALGLGIVHQAIQPADSLALLGIGSGINSIMMLLGPGTTHSLGDPLDLTPLA